MQGSRLSRYVIAFKSKQEAPRKELRFINQTRNRHFGKPSYIYIHIYTYIYNYVYVSPSLYLLLCFWALLALVGPTLPIPYAQFVCLDRQGLNTSQIDC